MHGVESLPPSPSFDANLSRVHGADVLLFFLESYGAVVYERPEFSSRVAAGARRSRTAIHASGHDVVSAFVESPTFGGSSWFAHLTLLSGLEVRDPDTNALLMTAHRDTLPTAFARHGYRTVAMMPGLWYPWPEGAFYGFTDIYNGARLNYHGTVVRLVEPDRSVHAGGARRARAASAVAAAAVRVLPDDQHAHAVRARAAVSARLAPDADATTVRPRRSRRGVFGVSGLVEPRAELSRRRVVRVRTLAGYVRQHTDEDFVMILIGDHQPPALVTGQGTPWDVPVHVITNRHDVLDGSCHMDFRRA